MSYKYSRGSQVIGDLKASDDTQRDTMIDFGEDQIDFQTSGSVRLQVSNNGVYIPDLDPSGSGPTALRVSGGIEVTPGHNAGLTFHKGNNELNFISFANEGDGISFNARMSYQTAEHLAISPGRSADFYINSGQASGDFTFPFSIMDDGTARFEKNLTSSATRAANLADDIAFYVSGTTDGNNNAVFVGNVKVSGSLKVGDAFTFPTSDGTANQILETNGSGQLSWVDNSGGAVTTTTDSKVLIAHLSSDFNVTTSETNGFLTVPFNNVLKNTFASSDFNTSTYTFTAPEEGYYFINCSLYHQSIDTSVAQYQIRISSSADWGFGGNIAFRNYFPGAMAETTIHNHRLDRVAHLSGSDEVKITIRPIASAGSYGTLAAYSHVSYLTIQKLEFGASHEDAIMAELSIPGLDLQTDTNAYTFNCPYNLTLQKVTCFLDTAGTSNTVVNLSGTAGNIVDITLASGSTSRSDTNLSNANLVENDRLRFSITTVGSGNPQGLRANLTFRRT